MASNGSHSEAASGGIQQSLWIEAIGATCRWHRYGTLGSPIVFLPCLNFPAVFNFHDLVTQPAFRNRQCVLFDYPGSGESDVAKTVPQTVSDLAGIISKTLDHLGWRDVTVIGHSMGGCVGIALALARPDLVAHLVVAEGNIDPGGGQASRKIAAQSLEDFRSSGFQRIVSRLQESAASGSHYASIMATAWADTDVETLHANARALVDLPPDFADAYFALSMKRTFLYGARSFPGYGHPPTPDAPDPARLVEAGITVSVVPDAGHFLMFDNCTGFVDALVETGVLDPQAP